jgi:hypothetical protein
MIRADLSDQTVVEDTAHKPVTATERYKRHGHHPALILVEDNPTLASRLERALFDDHFEVVQISGDDVSVDDLEKNIKLAQSSGLVIIYSSDALSPQEKLRLNAVAVDSFFDLSVLQLPAEEPDALRKVLVFLKPLRALADHKDQGKHD